jgi:hypothetical protein
MVNLFVTFKQLPNPIRLTTIVYLSCLLGYNIVGTYIDSKIYLDKYRTRRLVELNLSTNEIECIKSDWDAVKYGANSRALERLWDSIVWPVTTVKNIVPAIVLTMNPPPHRND